MVNSIRDSLDENDIISEIKLKLSQDKKKVFVVVEGEDDKKLFLPLLSANSEILQSYSSSIGVNKIVQYYFKDKRVIGIRDKDYFQKPINEQCFFCDYSCAEMMIISVDTCFERLYCNCYKGEMSSNKLRIHCLERLEKLSKLRKLSFINDWGVEFEKTKPGKFYQESIDNMNNAIIADLNIRNPQSPIDAERVRMCEELPKCSELADYLLITNGHDFINLFCNIVTTKHHQVAIDKIETTLRATFGKNEFSSTKLYKQLLDYQNENNITIVQ
ncbi:hypothetical protein IJG44_08750 [bacterium]|nr:hypothetical protein [bacterium]